MIEGMGWGSRGGDERWAMSDVGCEGSITRGGDRGVRNSIQWKPLVC